MKLHLILPVADTPDTREANIGIPSALSTLQKSTEVSVSYIQEGFESLDTLTRIAYNSPQIIQAALRAEADGADGIFINCFADPAADCIKELVNVPVFGAFRSSMIAALGCGKRISMIIPGKEGFAGKLLLSKVIENNPEFSPGIVHQGFTNLDVLELKDTCRLLNRLADFAEESERIYDCNCMVLGCTAMSYIKEELQTELKKRGINIVVIEPLSTGMKLLESFVQLGLNNSYAVKIKNDIQQFVTSPSYTQKK